MTDFTPFMSRIVDRLGQDVTIKVGVGPNSTLMKGVVLLPFFDGRVGNVPVERTDPSVSVKTAELSPTNAQPGDKVEIDAQDYTIVSRADQDGGISKLILRKFA